MSKSLTNRRRHGGFTLIELLVVISIISVLAGLTVGLSGLATRKNREARVRAELNRLINAIENYKSTLGFYPPDHQAVDNGGRPLGYAIPSPNQLFYELSGTVFQANNTYLVPGTGETVPLGTVSTLFGSSGFSNAAKEQKDVKFTEEFKANQFKRVPPGVIVLASPVKGPPRWALGTGSTVVNPWLYVSTSPTNNPGRFDLWTEVLINGKTIRFSNWEKDPAVLP